MCVRVGAPEPEVACSGVEVGSHSGGQKPPSPDPLFSVPWPYISAEL